MKYGLLLLIISFSLLTFLLGFSKTTSVSVAGDQYMYAWQSESAGYSDIKQLYQSDTAVAKTTFFNRKTLQSLQVSIQCGIRKTILRRDSQRDLAFFEIIEPVVDVKQAGQTVNTAIIKQELTRPVFVEMTHQGLMKEIRIDSAISNLSANMLKGMLSRLQFVSSANRVDEWQVTEENTSGVYLASYRKMQGQAVGLEIEKVNRGYTSLKHSKQNQKINENGRSIFLIDTTGTVVGINSEDAQVVLFSSDTVAISNTKVSVQLKVQTKATNGELNSYKRLEQSSHYNERTTLSAPLTEDKVNRLAYRKTLGSDNLESLMKALRQQDPKEEENLTLKFRALAYLNPGSCEKLGALLQAAPTGSYTFVVLSNALANADTQAAINALAKVIEARKGEEETVIDLLPALATTKTPTENAVKIARELAFSPVSTPDIASTAQLALGGMAYNFTRIDKPKSEQLTRFLLERFNTETDTIQKILVLANTGSPMILPVLHNYLTHPRVSTEVRTKAVSGLRLMEDSGSVHLLNKMIHHPDTVIVKKAKEVIDFRKEFFQGALTR